MKMLEYIRYIFVSRNVNLADILHFAGGLYADCLEIIFLIRQIQILFLSLGFENQIVSNGIHKKIGAFICVLFVFFCVYLCSQENLLKFDLSL